MTRPTSVRVRLSREEDGVSATIIVLGFFALLAVALLAVDGGFLYVSQRGQVADTDSAALAAARALAEEPCATQSEVDARADAVIDRNDASTTLEGGVVVDRDPGGPCHPRGVVRVDTTRDAVSVFAPAFGYDRLPTDVRSYAVFGPIDVLAGVRPIGICAQDPHYRNEYDHFIAHDRFGDDAQLTEYENGKVATDAEYAGYSGPAADAHPTVGPRGEDYTGLDVHRIAFERLAGNACGAAPGGFGWIDFNGAATPNGRTALSDRILDGYEGDISLGTTADGDEDCDASDDDTLDVNCPPETGAHGSATRSALSEVACDPPTPATDCPHILYVVVYTDLVGSGAGARLDMKSVAGVVLRGHWVQTGQLDGTHYLDVEFVDEIAAGVVAGSADPNYDGPLGATLCGAGNYLNC